MVRSWFGMFHGAVGGQQVTLLLVEYHITYQAAPSETGIRLLLVTVVTPGDGMCVSKALQVTKPLFCANLV